MKKIITLITAIIATISLTSMAQVPADAKASNVTGQKSRLLYATINMRYDEPRDGVNDWTHRRPRVADYISRQGWDIFGTQEMLAHQIDQLLEDLPQYGCIGIGREGGRKGEFCAIFYRKERFDTIAAGTFGLSQHPEAIGEKGWDAACPRIATWAELRDKHSGKVFMAVNTHFDHVGTTARCRSALLIIDKIKEIVGDKPAIVTGDFNVPDTSEAYHTITTNDFKLCDARKIAPIVEGEPGSWHDYGRLHASDNNDATAQESANNKIQQPYQIIDYVFVTPSVDVLKVDVPYSRTAPGEYLTDHNPVIATLQF